MREASPSRHPSAGVGAGLTVLRRPGIRTTGESARPVASCTCSPTVRPVGFGGSTPAEHATSSAFFLRRECWTWTPRSFARATISAAHSCAAEGKRLMEAAGIEPASTLTSSPTSALLSACLTSPPPRSRSTNSIGDPHDELAVVVEAWVRLPGVVRRAILGAVRAFE